jgi:cellulose synthase/poly-beta-1,6-N-acetylglucosamine synthase-like glycosyltransferase
MKLAILIPAHDERDRIEETVRRAREAAGSAAPVFVVADRCADDTAGRARSAGAIVFERPDGPPGKGAALAWFLDAAARHLEGVDALVVLDADSRLHAGSLEALARALDAGADAAQAFVRPVPDLASPSSLLAAFSEWTAQAVGDRLRHLLGGPVPLRGAGMAVRLDALCTAAPRLRSRVEDLELTLLLLDRRRRIAFVPAAAVEDPKPAGAGGVVRQRARWIQGHGEIVCRYPGLLFRLIAFRGPLTAWLVLSLLLKPKTFFLALRLLLTFGFLSTSPVLKIIGLVAAASVGIDILYYGTGFLTAPYAWRRPLAGALLRSPIYLVVWLAALARGIVSQEAWLSAREPQPTTDSITPVGRPEASALPPACSEPPGSNRGP